MHPTKPSDIDEEKLEAEALRKQREIKRAKIAAEVAAQLRDPFQKLLVDLLDAQPNLETLEAFATRHPNKWVTAIGVIGQMAGYTKDVHVTNLNVMQIGALPDSELLKRLEQAEQAQRLRMQERGLIAMVPRGTSSDADTNLSANSRSHPDNPMPSGNGAPTVSRETSPRSKHDDDRTIDMPNDNTAFKRTDRKPPDNDDEHV